jgi:hypothetical protein
MAAKTGTDAAAKWVAGMGSANQTMQQGAQAVTESPGALAARRSDAYLAGVQANVEKFKRNAQAVSVEDWRQAYLTKGLPRVASGAAASQQKFATIMDELIRYMKGAALPPRGTSAQQNAQRAVAQILHNANFRKS